MPSSRNSRIRQASALAKAAVVIAGLAFAVPTLSLALQVAAPTPAGAALQSWNGKVTRVLDGDTLEIDGGGSPQKVIRLAGINTNENHETPKCYADEATARLSSLVNGKQVTLRAQRANSYTKDNRAIRHVFVNGTNVSQLMLKEGYGMPIIFTENNEYDYAADYVTAFWEANRAGVGIHNPNLCGAGPRADFPITMSTNGDADGAEESNLNGEYVRLRNHGTTPFDLTGWQWKDSALEFYNFPSGTQISPGGALTIHTGQGTNTATDQYFGKTSSIFSGIDGAFLLDPQRDMRAFNFWPCVGPCNDTAAPNVEITRLDTAPWGTNDYFDLTNRGTTTVNLQDWRLESYPHIKTIDAPITLAPSATIRVTIGPGTDSQTGLFMNRSAPIFDPEPVGDSALAIDSLGNVVACKAYGKTTCAPHPGKARSERIGADFNGDGWADAALSAPGEDIGSVKNAGAVNVRYGEDPGITQDRPVFGIARLRPQFLSQSGPITGATETNDYFGDVTTSGDFNGDGYDELVIGVPREDVGSQRDAGAIHVLNGGPAGLDARRERSFDQNGPIPGYAESGDRFGAALAAGDFNHDGFDDLVVGVPGENASQGYLALIYGTANGLNDSGSVSIGQYGPVVGVAETGDEFAASLAADDLNADGFDDLAIGAPGEAFGTRTNVGMSHLLMGSANGLTTAGNYAVAQGDGAPGAWAGGERFAASLATGDVTGDGAADLVVGTPGDWVRSQRSAGSATVLHGSPSSRVGTNASVLTQSGALPGGAEANDAVGASVAVGDLDEDGYGDVIVGAPDESFGSSTGAGMVGIAFGAEGGVSGSGSIAQGTAPLTGYGAEWGDHFGAHLEILDRNGDGLADITVGVPGENLGSIVDSGTMHFFDGARNRAGTSPQRPGGSSIAYSQNAFGGGIEPGDAFGS